MLMRPILAAVVFTTLANTSMADTNAYVGLGADYATPHSGDPQSFGSVIAGATFDIWPEAALGAEIEFGQPIGGGDGRQTARLRLIYAYDFGQFTGLAAVGVNQYMIDDDMFGGQTVGLGAQMDLSPQMTGRFEFLRDFDDSAFGTDVTTARLAIFYNF